MLLAPEPNGRFTRLFENDTADRPLLPRGDVPKGLGLGLRRRLPPRLLKLVP